jgi:hypothetical protein
MEEKPWWVYACQIVILGCTLAILVMALAYYGGGADSAYLAISSSTVGWILCGLSLLVGLVLVVRLAARKYRILWEIFDFWLWW